MFRTRVVVLTPGARRPYEAAEWHDALVLVQRGRVELECWDGGRRAFARGAVLYLDGLPLSALHNPGGLPTVLVAITRLGRARRAGRIPFSLQRYGGSLDRPVRVIPAGRASPP